MTALIISNDNMEDILKILKSLKESSWLEKGVIKTIENKTKQKSGFLGMLLGNMLVGKAKILGWRVMREGKETIRAEQDF